MEIMDSHSVYPFFSLATLLSGAASLYGGALRLRRRMYNKGALPSYQLPCPVVSVGNLTVGGTGKTPLVIFLARLINSSGCRVAIISRGYKGEAQNRGAIVYDGKSFLCDAGQSGDEPYLMASLLENVPVVVGKDRYAAGKMALKKFKPDVLLLDDAFQHLRLKRDLNLLLLDAHKPFGNTYVLPRGGLREPTTAFSDADAIIITRWDESSADCRRFKDIIGRQRPVFRCMHRSVIRGTVPAHHPMLPLHRLDGAAVPLEALKVFCFAGLAGNQSFFDAVGQLGATIQSTMDFDDHHEYDSREILGIAESAVKAGAQCLITTDKDYVRLSADVRFPLPLIVMGVDLDFLEDDVKWQQFIKARIERMVHGLKANP